MAAAAPLGKANDGWASRCRPRVRRRTDRACRHKSVQCRGFLAHFRRWARSAL